MTKVNVLVKNGTFVIDVEGHAENSKVCTAVTMIMQLALIGLQKPMVRLFLCPFFIAGGYKYSRDFCPGYKKKRSKIDPLILLCPCLI